MAWVTLLEGFLSFFSPCILPILPLYFGYLSGNAKQIRSDGTVQYKQSIIFLYTILFVAGICFSFFLLGFSFTILGRFFEQSKYWIALFSGILVIVFGLLQLGVVRFKKLSQEKRLPFSINPQKMGLFTSFLLGFTFSFAWTPCVGPTLSSVLLISANTSFALGLFYILCYAVGFIVPFLVLGLFTSQVLNFLKRNQKRLRYVIRFAGIILIFMGFYLVGSNGIQLYRTFLYQKQDQAYDFTFQDQYGVDQNLSEYHDQVIILSFLDRHCVSCQHEMVELQKLYQDFGQNKNEIVILGAMKMGIGDTESSMRAYLDQNGYHFPILYDYEDRLKISYDVTDYPTTLLFDNNGYKREQLTGQMNGETLLRHAQKYQCGKEIC